MMGPDALGRLLDAHAAGLTLYARQWCAAPEDVVQEAFLKLAGRTDSPPDVVGWLYAVTRNLARTAGRSERRRRQHEAAPRPAPRLVRPGRASRLTPRPLPPRLPVLPPEEREAVVARIWGGLSFEQIGELLGSSAATAHRRFTAGLALLRERLNHARVPARPRTRRRERGARRADPEAGGVEPRPAALRSRPAIDPVGAACGRSLAGLFAVVSVGLGVRLATVPPQVEVVYVRASGASRAGA